METDLQKKINMFFEKNHINVANEMKSKFVLYLKKIVLNL